MRDKGENKNDQNKGFIIIPFDELPPYHIDPKKLKDSLERTHRWEKRSLDKQLKYPSATSTGLEQAMYAVIHGGIDQELRRQSCEYLTNLPFDGFAIGGSLGKNHQEMFDLLKFVVPQLPEDKPNHLLGIGDLKSIDTIVKLGIDTFDSSHPTRCARHGLIFTPQGTQRILASSNKNRLEPIDKHCTCYTCQNYSAAYLHHLFKANEISGLTLATIHNLHFMVQLMKNYREQILAGNV